MDAPCHAGLDTLLFFLETRVCFLDTLFFCLDTLCLFLETRFCFIDTLLLRRHTSLVPGHNPLVPRHTVLLPRHTPLLLRHGSARGLADSRRAESFYYFFRVSFIFRDNSRKELDECAQRRAPASRPARDLGVSLTH